MASFYNNYYRYYRPYSSKINNTYSNKDKSDYDDDISLSSSRECSKQDFPKEKTSSRYYSFGPVHFKNPLFDDIEEPIFEMFGIQLYLDDIIILGLLFFLYQEQVQDEMLYIALILLLLS